MYENMLDKTTESIGKIIKNAESTSKIIMETKNKLEKIFKA